MPLTPPGDVEDGPSILGFPAEVVPDDDGGDAAQEPVPAEASTGTGPRLVVRRRAEVVGGSALVLAGAAANVSLWLPWVEGEKATGMSLVRRGLSGGPEVGEVLSTGLWQPVAVVLGGGVLVLLGMLLFVPAQTHRLVGVLALLVALTATAAVVNLLAGADWNAARFDLGMWCGVAVAAFGLAGALKAMLTLPVVTTEDGGEG